MGVKVTVTLDDQIKPDYTVADQAAGIFTIGSDELVVWIGATSDTFGGSFQVSGCVRAGELIRENGNATPTGLNVTQVIMPAPGYKLNANVIVNSALVLPTEDDVVVGFGATFQALPGASVTAHVKRALEKYLESRA